MKLEPLYEIQAKLKERIGYKKEDKFRKMMLAMLVEFMECANDWRGFKYWSEDQNAKKTLLEEYVDGLHFVLETGLDLVGLGKLFTLPSEAITEGMFERTIEEQFMNLVGLVYELNRDVKNNSTMLIFRYKSLVNGYLALGEMLGFAAYEIETAYLEKNKENHDRQNRGY